MAMAEQDLAKLGPEHGGYRGQFFDAMVVSGGELENAGFFDFLLHFVAFFWKVKVLCDFRVTEVM